MRVKTRITLHFLLQLIISFIVLSLFFLLMTLLVMNFIMEDELNRNPKKAIVENVPYSTFIENGEFVISGDWPELIVEHDVWMQIIDEDGNVVEELNAPRDLADSYTINELLTIDETKKLEEYSVETFLDTMSPERYLFMLGYVDENQHLVEQWFAIYSENGMVSKEDKDELAQEVEKHNGLLTIYKDGTLVEEIGESIPAAEKALDVLQSVYEPGLHEMNAYIVNAEEGNISWVFQQINDAYTEQSLQILSNSELQLFLIVIASSLFIVIIMSVWYGYYYGKPLLLLANWLQMVEQKQYEDLLEGKEYRKIHRKNGKVKFRYRLFKSVFDSFSRMSQKLAQAEKERKQLEKTREEWMTGISHDLRTPLSSIQGYGHMLESGEYRYTDEELQQIGSVIRTQSVYMVDLVNDFSLIFRLKNSALTLNKEKTEMNEFIREAFEKYTSDVTLESYRITFQPSPFPCYGMIDPKWFTRVIDNLVSNAIKHNPPDTEIRLQLHCDASSLKIIIADNGKGMDPSSVEHLFQRYYRGTATDERTEGDGLGMSIALGIVELHGGTIEVESELEKGTTVIIILNKDGKKS